MIKIRKGSVILDTAEDMEIERERLSPFFTPDEIPGEVSYPFGLPPTDTNLQELGYIDQVPIKKDATHDVQLMDEPFQVSNAKLMIESVETDLNMNNSGVISAYTLSNVGEFNQRIKDKNLSQLYLDGPRTFAWDGYNISGTGFWAHVHDTWNGGDYSFYPIYNPGYKGFTRGWMNWLTDYSGIIELNRIGNLNSLCPAINLVYLLKNIFKEHGYQLTGSLLTDGTFSAITIPSFYGVYWADYHMFGTAPFDIAIPDPLTSITINLQDHVPPDFLISTFLVELQQFLPVGFDIDDNTRTCELVMLGDISPVGAKDWYNEIDSSIKTELSKEQKIYALQHEVDNADSFDIKADMNAHEIDSLANLPYIVTTGFRVFVKDIQEYWQMLSGGYRMICPNTGEYKPANSNGTIGSKISTMPLSEQEMYTATSIGVHGYFPACNQEGNWKGKQAEVKKWGVRFLFYNGRNEYRNTGINLPFAYPTNYHINGSLSIPYIKLYDWSVCFEESGGDGMYKKLFEPWLRTFANREKIYIEWRPTLQEYLKFRWRHPFLVNNTPYLVEKIIDKLPFERPGDPKSESVDVTARRMN